MSEVVSIKVVGQMRAKLFLAVIMVALGGRVLDRAIRTLNPAIDPRMVWLGQPMLDAVGG